jgi:hypothetical protein
MELKNVNILSAKFGLKKISIKYYDNRVGQNRSAEEVDYPTPDLINARDDLRDDLAKSYYIEERDEQEKFSVTGFEISEKDSIRTLDIKGQMTNYHEYLVDVSGKIPLDEDQEDLKLKVDTLIMELFEFIFNAKTSSGKLEGFPANAQQENEMKESDDGSQNDGFDDPPPVVEGSQAEKAMLN